MYKFVALAVSFHWACMYEFLDAAPVFTERVVTCAALKCFPFFLHLWSWAGDDARTRFFLFCALTVLRARMLPLCPLLRGNPAFDGKKVSLSFVGFQC